MRLLNTFRSLFQRKPRTIRKSRPATPRPRVQLGVENLESRELMAGALTASFNYADRILRIEGTPQADNIRIVNNAGQVRVAGLNIRVNEAGRRYSVASLPKSEIRSAEVKALDGNDRIRMVELNVTPQTALALKAFGGSGDDVIIGGSAKDELYGGSGEEEVNGTDLAAQLDQEKHLYYASELDNYRGLNEKWFIGSGFLDFNYMTPDGKLYESGGTLIATLAPAYYQNPALLAEADSGARAYHLDRDLHLTAYVPEADNMFGLDERWLQSDTEQSYFITSDGSLHRHDSGGWFSELVAPVIAVLDESYWKDPNKLVNAQALFTPDNDTIRGGAGNDAILGGVGDDVLEGGAGADVVRGMSGHDRIEGDFAGALASSPSNDTLFGESGNDTLHGHQGRDQLFGGTGEDQLDGGNDADRLVAGPGQDTLRGGAGNDTLYGEEGNDRLYGNTGHDSLYGGAGEDWLEGDDAYVPGVSLYLPGHDNLDGGYGWDTLMGSIGNDTLWGGPGSDRLYGDRDNDLILGDDGYDFAWGGVGHDTLRGGAGNDELRGESGNDELHGDDGDDFAWGGIGNDTIYGDAGVDVLRGEGNNDALYGGGNTDWLFGDDGNDGLFGGWGDGIDYLTGGAGADRFLMSAFNIAIAKIDEDAIGDFFGEDAQLNFLNGEKNWTDAEIIALDKGLQWLHQTTNNTRLLESRDGRSMMNFFRYVSLLGNSFNPSPAADNDGFGTIRFADATFASTAADQVMVHEIAHNWDWSTMSAAQANAWSELSGWRIHDLERDPIPTGYRRGANFYEDSSRYVWIYKSTARFARDYGRNNPDEDFATCLEMYYALGSPGTVSVLWQAKWNFIDSWLKSLKT